MMHSCCDCAMDVEQSRLILVTGQSKMEMKKKPVMNICRKTSNTFYRYSLLLLISAIIKKAMSHINCRRTLSQFQYAQKTWGKKNSAIFLYLILAHRGNMDMNHIAKKKKKKMRRSTTKIRTKY